MFRMNPVVRGSGREGLRSHAALLLATLIIAAIPGTVALPAGPSLLSGRAGVSPAVPRSAAGSSAIQPASNNPSWTNLTGPASPPARYEAAMTYDEADHEVVLFGGLGLNNVALNDTWTFKGGVWTNITPILGFSPSPRYGMAITYDRADGYVLMYGGESTSNYCTTGSPTNCNLTWEFRANKWTELNTSIAPGSLSAPPSGAVIAYDSIDGYVLANAPYGTWKFAAGTWSQFCGTNCTNFIYGPQVANAGMACDPVAGYVLLFGGGSTWKFVGGKWTNLTSSLSQSPVGAGSLLSYDNASGGIMLVESSYGGTPSPTWIFRSGGWTNVTAGQSPPGASGAAIANDEGDSLVLVFGGTIQSSHGVSSWLDDTWAWGTNPPISQLDFSVNPSAPQPGEVATFTPSFQGGVGPFTFRWNFGDGNSSSVMVPSHAYPLAGHYAVSVETNDSVGHSATFSLTVWVYLRLAIASLTASPNPATLGAEVTFTSSIDGGTPPFAYSWSFGDGQTGGNLSTIVHVYTTNGPFTAQLTVSDAVGERVQSAVDISIALAAVATSSAPSGSSPFYVAFTAGGQGGYPPYTYSWNFGDGSPGSTLANPSHTYNASGTYFVTLTVTDARADTATSSLAVVVMGGAPPAPLPWWVLPSVGLASAGVVAVTAAWIVDRHRRRVLRKEGQDWVEELSGEPSERPR